MTELTRPQKILQKLPGLQNRLILNSGAERRNRILSILTVTPIHFPLDQDCVSYVSNQLRGSFSSPYPAAKAMGQAH